jgi:hypothetical protein
MTQYIRYALSLAAACSTAAVLSAQTPPQPQTPPRPQTPTTQPAPTPKPDAQPAAGTVTISGCLKAEKDVAGLKPNVAERAGMGEDYILTNVKMAPGASGSSPAAAASKAVMYKIEGLSDDELKKHLNHQVELTGRISDSGSAKPGGTAAPGGGGAPSETLKEFQATSLKMVSATCPAQTN